MKGGIYIQKKYIDCFGVEPERYIIYDDGSVYDTKLEKYKTTSIDKDGYLYIALSIDGHIHKKFRLNRIVCQCFHPIDNPKDFEANHINGIVDDNRAINLNWLTQYENIRHAIDEVGYDNIGEHHPNNIYSEELVHEICKSLANGIFRAHDILEDIERRTGWCVVLHDVVSFQNLIMNIRQGKIWTHISSKYNIKKMTIKDYRGKFWERETIEDVCKLIIKGYSNKEISLMMFNDDNKNVRDYVYRIRKGAFRDISEKYW